MKIKKNIKDCLYLVPALLSSFIVMSILNRIFGTVCTMKIIFGIPCPGCGLTRATKLLCTGHIKESLDMHPLLILIIIGAILYVYLTCVNKNHNKIIVYYALVCTIIFIAFYIYRMIEYFPNKEPLVYFHGNLLEHFIKLKNI